MPRSLAFFPVDYETVPLVRYALKKGMEPIAMLAPNLVMFLNEDISKIDNGASSGVVLRSDYKNLILESDSIYFMHSREVADCQLYEELISFARENGKGVFITECLKNKLESTEINVVDMGSPRLKPIDIPIISVFATGYNCGQMETELSTLEYFMSRDHNTLYVGDERVAKLSGGSSLPTFLFDPNVSVEQKVIKFNQFVYDICKERKPDVVILSVPNPIMKYNDDILNGLGILPFAIQKSVKSDIGILCIHYMDYNYKYLQYLSRYCEFCLNCRVSYFSLSDITAFPNVNNQNELEYLQIQPEMVSVKINEGVGKDEYTLFSVFGGISGEYAFAKIEEELIANPLVL